MPAIDDLLFPLSSQAGLDGICRADDILRIDVAANSQGIKVAQTPLARAAQTVSQEKAFAMAEDDIGNDLRLTRILFHLPARPEPVAASNPAEELIESRIAEPGPFIAGEQIITGDDQDFLARAHRLECTGDLTLQRLDLVVVLVV
jgi:hypothetical protein